MRCANRYGVLMRPSGGIAQPDSKDRTRARGAARNPSVGYSCAWRLRQAYLFLTAPSGRPSRPGAWQTRLHRSPLVVTAAIKASSSAIDQLPRRMPGSKWFTQRSARGKDLRQRQWHARVRRPSAAVPLQQEIRSAAQWSSNGGGACGRQTGLTGAVRSVRRTSALLASTALDLLGDL